MTRSLQRDLPLKILREKNNNKKAKTKTKLNIQKALGNNVKLKSDKTLTTQIFFFLTQAADGIYLNETRQQVNKKKKY